MPAAIQPWSEDMSTIPPPAQAAAARRERLAQEAAAKRLAGIAYLKDRCVKVIMESYDGNSYSILRLVGEDREYVAAVEKELTGWSLYASSDGNLYMGDQVQIEPIRARDVVPTPPPNIEYEVEFSGLFFP
jgi:hypothetical protein